MSNSVDPPGVVIDCMVFVQAAANEKSPSARIFDLLDHLISRDKDLLDLMSWKKDEGREFQKRFPFLRIVTPEDFLLAVENRRD